jgi:hypothetical protein
MCLIYTGDGNRYTFHVPTLLLPVLHFLYDVKKLYGGMLGKKIIPALHLLRLVNFCGHGLV